jgi:hypothetical protein
MKLCGTVNPSGESTTYHFEYEYYENGPRRVETAAASAGAGEAAMEVCDQVDGLTPSTFYSYKLIAVNASGEAEGAELYAQTPQAVAGLAILPITNVETHSMIVHGTLEPNGYDTHYYFACAQIRGGAQVVQIPIYRPERPGGDAGSANGSTEVEARLDALGANTPYTCHLVATNEFGTTITSEGSEAQAITQQAAPEVDSPHPSAVNVTARTATVHGVVATQNESTRYWVQFVGEAGYEPGAENPYVNGVGSTVSDLPAEAVLSSPVEVDLSGLSPQATYHYRLVAENATGTTYGPDYTFTTAELAPPIVATAPAVNVSPTSATLTGSVDARGSRTSYEFEIGTSAGYGGAEIFGNGGEGETLETVSTTLGYLVPGTTYHYRLVATNVEGTSYGPDETFTTPPVSSPIVQPPSTPLLGFTSLSFPSEKGAPKATKPNTKHKTAKKRRKRRKKRATKHKK